SSNIAASPVNVIKEDSENENLLYLGTDNGAYVSFNQGESWEVFSKDLPNVAIHDIVIQTEAKDLLLGTHGRSIYKTDISELQLMNTNIISNPITLFKVEDVRYSSRWGSSWGKWYDAFEPEMEIAFFSNTSGNKTIKILSEKDTILNEIYLEADKGFNFASYDLTLTEKGKKALMKENTTLQISKAQNDKFYLPKGTYTIQIGEKKTELIVK
ncbi:MAG: glycosyl hydrolase, partial [Psychroserpens sp.]